jgi:hypothetical protein
LNELNAQDRQERSEQVTLLRVPPPVAFVELEESVEEIEEVSGDAALLFWILALLFFGLGDIITSFLVFSIGGSELNPIMRWSTHLPGGLLGFVFLKILAIAALYAIAYFWRGMHRWMIPMVMTGVGVYLTVSNTATYMGWR